MKRQAHKPTIPSSYLLKWWRISLMGLSGGFTAAAALAQATPAAPDAGQPYVYRVIECLPEADSALQLKSSEYN